MNQISLYLLNQNEQTMKTFKANRSDWREKVLKALNMEYTIKNDIIVVKGSIGDYKSLVHLLVDQRIKLGILPY